MCGDRLFGCLKLAALLPLYAAPVDKQPGFDETDILETDRSPGWRKT
jgi:hypothetical protein